MAAPHIGAEWLRRVEAEYTSAAITASYVQWLIRLGAPVELIREGLRVIDDELEHAALSSAVVAAAGCDARPTLVQERLGLVRSQNPLYVDGLLACVESFCLGETVAVPLFVSMRKDCTEPSAREALDRIVRDEVRHRDFGWSGLDWFVQSFGDAAREVVTRALPPMGQRLAHSYGQPGVEPADDVGPQGAAWGLLSVHRYAEILQRCAIRDYLPRFEALGIDATHVWQPVRHNEAAPA